MILNGECGAFNPLLMECLVEISEDLRSKLHSGAVDHDYLAEAQQISAKVLHNSNLPEQDNTSRARRHPPSRRISSSATPTRCSSTTAPPPMC